MSQSSIFRALLRAVRPVGVLVGVLMYILGSGIARYLGTNINWPVFWIGMAIITVLQLSADFLREYFDLAGVRPPFESRREPVRQKPKPAATPDNLQEENEPAPPPVPAPRVAYLQVAATLLTIGAALTVLLYAQRSLPAAAGLFLGLAFVLVITYAVPPFRLAYSGYGELILAILNANLFSALAYLLQVGDLHRLLALLTFPLTFLYLAQELARSLHRYMDDIRLGRQTMLVRLGWQRGMSLHNALVGGAYLLVAISVMSGLSPRLAMPAILSVPLGAFQIWQISAIANGAKPRWRLLTITAVATLGLTIYFINLALWTG